MVVKFEEEDVEEEVEADKQVLHAFIISIKDHMIARWTEIRIRKDLKSLNPKLSQSQFNKKRRVLLKKTKNQSLDKDHNNRVNNNTLMKKTIHKVKDQEATLNKNKNKNKELKNPINKKKVENMKSKDHRWVRMKRKVGHTNKRRKNLYL